MPLNRRDLLVASTAAALSMQAAPVAAASINQNGDSMTALNQIRQIDYTVIFARNMHAMREFYETVMEFPINRALGDAWIEYRVGSNILALTTHGNLFNDTPPEPGALSLQLAFRVAPDVVGQCAEALQKKGITLVLPVTDQPWGHRTMFFRDPDGNVLEIFAEI
jgi:lactoylglutathione lyase